MEHDSVSSKYRRFPLAIRIISVILIISFLAYDISWACPTDDATSVRRAYPDKLAVPGLKNKDVLSRLKAALIVELIEKRSALRDRLDKVKLKDILDWQDSKEEEFKSVRFEPIKYNGILQEVRLYLTDYGLLIRYFDSNAPNRIKSTPNGCIAIEETHNLHPNSPIQRQILKLLKLLPAPSVASTAVQAESKEEPKLSLTKDEGFLFVQDRVGYQGKIFKCYKIRTMDEDGNVTGLGRFLRKFGLDELPQVLNVLKGETAIFGPRPLIPAEVDQEYIDKVLSKRKPGFIGILSAIYGPDRQTRTWSLEQEKALELYEIDELSKSWRSNITWKLRLVWMTLLATFFNKKMTAEEAYLKFVKDTEPEPESEEEILEPSEEVALYTFHVQFSTVKSLIHNLVNMLFYNPAQLGVNEKKIKEDTALLIELLDQLKNYRDLYEKYPDILDEVEKAVKPLVDKAGEWEIAKTSELHRSLTSHIKRIRHIIASLKAPSSPNIRRTPSPTKHTPIFSIPEAEQKVVSHIFNGLGIGPSDLQWREEGDFEVAEVSSGSLDRYVVLTAFNLPENTEPKGTILIIRYEGIPMYLCLEQEGLKPEVLDLTAYYSISDALLKPIVKDAFDFIREWLGNDFNYRMGGNYAYTYAVFNRKTGELIAWDTLGAVRDMFYGKIPDYARVVKIPVLPGVYPGLHESSILSAISATSFVRPGMKVLVLGTGTGLEALIAAEKGAIVDAVDIKEMAVENTKLTCSLSTENITGYVNVFQSDLFEKLKGKRYDLVIFNMPQPELPRTASRLVEPKGPMKPADRDAIDFDLALLERVASNIAAHLARGGRAIIINSTASEVLEFLRHKTGLHVESDPSLRRKHKAQAYVLSRKESVLDLISDEKGQAIVPEGPLMVLASVLLPFILPLVAFAKSNWPYKRKNEEVKERRKVLLKILKSAPELGIAELVMKLKERGFDVSKETVRYDMKDDPDLEPYYDAIIDATKRAVKERQERRRAALLDFLRAEKGQVKMSALQTYLRSKGINMSDPVIENDLSDKRLKPFMKKIILRHKPLGELSGEESLQAAVEAKYRAEFAPFSKPFGEQISRIFKDETKDIREAVSYETVLYEIWKKLKEAGGKFTSVYGLRLKLVFSPDGKPTVLRKKDPDYDDILALRRARAPGKYKPHKGIAYPKETPPSGGASIARDSGRPSDKNVVRANIIKGLFLDTSISQPIQRILREPSVVLTLLGVKPATSIEALPKGLRDEASLSNMKTLLQNRFGTRVNVIWPSVIKGMGTSVVYDITSARNAILTNMDLFTNEELDKIKTDEGLEKFLKNLIFERKDQRRGIVYGYPKEDVIDEIRYAELKQKTTGQTPEELDFVTRWENEVIAMFGERESLPLRMVVSGEVIESPLTIEALNPDRVNKLLAEYNRALETVSTPKPVIYPTDTPLAGAGKVRDSGAKDRPVSVGDVLEAMRPDMVKIREVVNLMRENKNNQRLLMNYCETIENLADSLVRNAKEVIEKMPEGEQKKSLKRVVYHLTNGPSAPLPIAVGKAFLFLNRKDLLLLDDIEARLRIIEDRFREVSSKKFPVIATETVKDMDADIEASVRKAISFMERGDYFSAGDIVNQLNSKYFLYLITHKETPGYRRIKIILDQLVILCTTGVAPRVPTPETRDKKIKELLELILQDIAHKNEYRILRIVINKKRQECVYVRPEDTLLRYDEKYRNEVFDQKIVTEDPSFTRDDFIKKFSEDLARQDIRSKLWLGILDIDLFYHVNRVFGKELCNVVLRDIREIIREVVSSHKGWYFYCGGDEAIIAAIGDNNDEIKEVFDKIRREIKLQLRRKYGVISFSDLDETKAAVIEQSGVILDRSNYREANLGLVRFGLSENLDTVIDEKLAEIKRRLKSLGISGRIEGRKDAANNGYVWGPTVTIGVIRAGEALQEVTQEKRRTGFETWKYIHDRAEYSVDFAKKDGRDRVKTGLVERPLHERSRYSTTTILTEERLKASSRARPVAGRGFLPKKFRDGHNPAYSTERYLREKAYEKFGKAPLWLIEVEAVYSGRLIDELKAKLSAEEKSQLRGDEHGIGLKGLNIMLGHLGGDEVIKNILYSVAETLPREWIATTGKNHGPPVLMSRLADRARIVVPADEISEKTLKEFADRISTKLNEGFAQDIKGIVKVTAASSQGLSSAGQLFGRLEFTSLSQKATTIPTAGGNTIRLCNPDVSKDAINIQRTEARESMEILASYKSKKPDEVQFKVGASVLCDDRALGFGEIIEIAEEHVTCDFQGRRNVRFTMEEAFQRLYLIARGDRKIRLSEFLMLEKNFVDTAKSNVLIDGIDIELPKGFRLAGNIGRVVVLTDMDMSHNNPSVTVVKPDNLNAFINCLRNGIPIFVFTGEAHREIYDNLINPIRDRLERAGRQDLLANLYIVYDSGAGGFGFEKDGQEKAHWEPRLLDPDERRQVTISMVEMFYGELKKVFSANNWPISDDAVEAEKDKKIDYIRRSFTSEEWISANSKRPFKLELIPQQWAGYCGDMNFIDRGSKLTINLHPTKAYEDKFDRVAKNIEEALRPSIQGREDRFLTSAPSFLDYTNSEKVAGAAKMFAIVKERAGINEATLIIMGDSLHDIPVMKHEFGRGMRNIGFFLGEPVKEAEDPNIIMSLRRYEKGGAKVLEAAAQASGKRIDEVILPKNRPAGFGRKLLSGFVIARASHWPYIVGGILAILFLFIRYSITVSRYVKAHLPPATDKGKFALIMEKVSYDIHDIFNYIKIVFRGLKTGDEIGGHKLSTLIFNGINSKVFKSIIVRNKAKRLFAIKIITPNMPDFESKRKLLEKEAALADKLNHPNLVKIHRIIKLPGHLCLITEYVEGLLGENKPSDLETLMKERALSIDEKLRVFGQAVKGLDYLHSQRIVHGDIKPENILVSKDWNAKLVDFGFAEPIKYDSQAEREKKRLQIHATPAYMPPEQLQGKNIDQRSDIYSLGMAMYEAFTGSNPYRDMLRDWRQKGKSIVQQVIMLNELLQAGMQIQKPREINPNIPPELERIILKCIARKPENRYQSAKALYEDLKSIMTEEEISAFLEKWDVKEFKPEVLRSIPSQKAGTDKYWIITLCNSNWFRSPMAFSLIKRLIKEMRLEGKFEAISGGLHVGVNKLLVDDYEIVFQNTKAVIESYLSNFLSSLYLLSRKKPAEMPKGLPEYQIVENMVSDYLKYLLEQHVPKDINLDDIDKASLILVADRRQREELLEKFNHVPGLERRVFLITQLLDSEDKWSCHKVPDILNRKKNPLGIKPDELFELLYRIVFKGLKPKIEALSKNPAATQRGGGNRAGFLNIGLLQPVIDFLQQQLDKLFPSKKLTKDEREALADKILNSLKQAKDTLKDENTRKKEKRLKELEREISLTRTLPDKRHLVGLEREFETLRKELIGLRAAYTREKLVFAVVKNDPNIIASFESLDTYARRQRQGLESGLRKEEMLKFIGLVEHGKAEGAIKALLNRLVKDMVQYKATYGLDMHKVRSYRDAASKFINEIKIEIQKVIAARKEKKASSPDSIDRSTLWGQLGAPHLVDMIRQADSAEALEKAVSLAIVEINLGKMTPDEFASALSDKALKSKLVQMLEDPSEKIREAAAAALNRIGESADRWKDILNRLREKEAANKDGEVNACFTPQDTDWFLAEKGLLAFIRQLTTSQDTCDLAYIEELFYNLPYLTKRHAYLLSLAREEKGRIIQTRILVYPPQDTKGRLDSEGWQCDQKTFPEGPDNFFKIDEKEETLEILSLRELQKEAATIAYSIEGTALHVNDFLISGPYRNRLIASWLFERLVRRLFEEGKINRIRFDYQAIGAREFLLGISQPSPQRLLIGPFQDEYGEYYLPGEAITGAEVEIRIKPEVLIGIGRDLVMATDPDKTFNVARGEIEMAINKISEAAGIYRLYIYSPVLGEFGRPSLTSGRERYLWRSTYQRGEQVSRIQDTALVGEKRLLEMMAQGKIDPINIEGVSHYAGGIWRIYNRTRLHNALKEDPRYRELKTIIQEDDELLARDLSEEGYGRVGNSICYAYAVDADNNPLFLFAAIGELNDVQMEVIRSGFLPATVAAERANLMHLLTERRNELDRLDRMFIGLRIIHDRLHGFFHAMTNLMVAPIAYFKMTKSEEGSRALETNLGIQNLYEESTKRLKSIDEMLTELARIKEEAVPSGIELIPVSRDLSGIAPSLLNIFSNMLTAKSEEELRSRIRQFYYDRIISRGDSIYADLEKTTDVALKYQRRLKELKSLIGLLNPKYEEAMEHYRAIAANLESIPERLAEIRGAIIEWKSRNGEVFKLLEAVPPEIKKDTVEFHNWIRGPSPKLAERTLDEYEAANIRAAYNVENFIPVLDEFISFAPGALRSRVVLEKVDIVKLVKDAIELGKSQAEFDRIPTIPVRYEPQVPSCEIVTDPPIVKPFVIADLIKNAMKYNRSDGREVVVDLSVDREYGYVRISVTDNGVGISEEDRKEHLFRRESRLEATKDKVTGTGYGLYLAKRSVQWVGGQLILEESTPGVGSTFTVYLPLEGHNTVWSDTPQKEKWASDKVALCEHITGNLYAATQTEDNILAQVRKEGREPFRYPEEFERLKTDLGKAHQISLRLSEDLMNRDLSLAYLIDALKRRLRPLFDTVRIRRMKDALKEYYSKHGVEGKQIDSLSIWDKNASFIEELFKDLSDSADEIKQNSVQEKPIFSFESLYSTAVSALKALISKDTPKAIASCIEALSQYKPVDISTPKGLILYADSILEQGAIIDLEDTLRKATILNNSKIIIYGQKDNTAKTLENIIRTINPSITIIRIESQDLIDRYGQAVYDEVNELDKLLQFLSIKGINNIKLLGVIKGKALDAQSIESYSTSHKLPIVLFEKESGIYSFSEALRKVLEINDTDGPRDNRWCIRLPPIKELTPELERGYQDYLRILQELETKA